MANLIVTFGKSLGGKLEDAADARTELIAIGGGHVEGTLEARANEDVITLYAEGDCWVVVGVNPDAEASSTGSPRRFMKEGWQRQYGVRTGMKVSVTS